MLENIKVTAFTLSELLMENQQEGKITHPPTQIRVKGCFNKHGCNFHDVSEIDYSMPF